MSKPWYWIIWHPHQKLWNWELVEFVQSNSNKFISAFIVKLIIGLDTFLLKLRISFSSKRRNAVQYSEKTQINYFDLGTHREAKELNLVLSKVLANLPNPYNIYAFEANPNSFEVASSHFVNNNRVKLFNTALVRDLPQSGQIKLYKGSASLEDSIYRKQENFVEVPANKLSQIIEQEQIDLSQSINILRMNIEGAELDILEDLIENDLIKYFNAFYGMWDDMSKIDIHSDKVLRKKMSTHKISPITFNGRDLGDTQRKKWITKSLRSNII